MSQEVMTFRNFYFHCNAPWIDEWSCACNDMCPKCGTKDIEPFHSEDINQGSQELLDLLETEFPWLTEGDTTEEEDDGTPFTEVSGADLVSELQDFRDRIKAEVEGQSLAT